MNAFLSVSTQPIAGAVHSEKHSEKHFIPGFEFHSVLLIAALVLLTATAHAQAPAASTGDSSNSSTPSRPQVSQSSDGNVGSIPPNRAPSSRDIDAAFNKADANGDGRLDRQEAAQFPPVLQRFDMLDADHDGFVTRAELARVAGS